MPPSTRSTNTLLSFNWIRYISGMQSGPQRVNRHGAC